MFKKIIAAACAFMLTVSMGAVANAEEKENIVGVYTAEDLFKIDRNTDVVHMRSDIDLTGYDWDGIDLFSGKFNGNGYCIRNMKSDSCGLFYRLGSGAEIKDIRIEDAEIVTDTKMLGGIVSYIPKNVKNVEITDCYVSGVLYTSYSNAASSLNFCGGIAGVISSKGVVVRNCASSAIVEASFGSGGIVGLNYGTVEGSVFTGRVNNCFNDHNYCNCGYEDGEQIHLEIYSIGTAFGGITAVNYGTLKDCISLVSRYDQASYVGLVSAINIKNKGKIENCRALKTFNYTDDSEYRYNDVANTLTAKKYLSFFKR